MNFYRYSVFGLTISVPIRCALLTPSDLVPDIEVIEGPVPKRLDHHVERRVRLQTAPGRALLIVDGVARFLVSRGSQVVMDAQAGIDADTLQHFLLGPALELCMAQRGCLVLNAVCLIGRGSTYALAGLPGSGKSTLAAVLVQRGHRLVADNPVVVDHGKGRSGLVLRSGIPHLRLWADSIEALALEASKIKRIRPKLEKWWCVVDEGTLGQPGSLDRIYLLEANNSMETVIVRLAGAKKFDQLVRHGCWSEPLVGMKCENAAFNEAASVASAVKIARFAFPRRLDALDAVGSAIEDDVKGGL